MVSFHLDCNSEKLFTKEKKVNCLFFVPHLAQAAAAVRIVPIFVMQNLLVGKGALNLFSQSFSGATEAVEQAQWEGEEEVPP